MKKKLQRVKKLFANCDLRHIICLVRFNWNTACIDCKQHCCGRCDKLNELTSLLDLLQTMPGHEFCNIIVGCRESKLMLVEGAQQQKRNEHQVKLDSIGQIVQKPSVSINGSQLKLHNTRSQQTICKTKTRSKETHRYNQVYSGQRLNCLKFSMHKERVIHCKQRGVVYVFCILKYGFIIFFYFNLSSNS